LKAHCDYPEINNRLLLCLEGSLPADEQNTIMQHAKECAVCSAELQELKEILGIVKQHAAASARSSCLTPKVLINYAEQRNTLSDAEIKSVQTHLASCSACNKEYDCLIQLQKEPMPQPDFIVMAQKEKEFLLMVSRQLSPSPRLLSAAKRTIAAVLTGWKERMADWVSGLFSPQPELIVVRKGKRNAGEHISVIKERSQGIAVRIETEPVTTDSVELIVFLSAPGNKKLLEGMRASLFHGGQERASFMLRNGKVVFKRMPHNTYELALIKEGKEVKRIQFTTR
jgi:hypothetical protein